MQGTPGTKSQLVPETAKPVKPTEAGTIWLVLAKTMADVWVHRPVYPRWTWQKRG